ncbi:hypothetical protein [Chroococcus sp. FPU101]|uniref:hypothetical protein n=1 Tax=Chroococcus sp. FPU101 TaxID=1974212 RepID=UPI001A8ECA74|nr:hypothetical protein [Chroococcus sp. FPU101]GFE68021.1 hypothetical protein CFPU101_06310 [Chroococcus sp. FPU101]
MTSIKTLILSSVSTALLATPSLAFGQFTVEDIEGAVDIYSNVRITHTDDSLYFKASDSELTLIINKKDCKMEKAIQVCSTGNVSVNTYGVDESLDVEQI